MTANLAVTTLAVPPLPLDRPTRFSVSREYIRRLRSQDTSGGRAAIRTSEKQSERGRDLEVMPMSASDILKNLE